MGSFKDVVGHKDIINYIRSAVEKDKVSHAYILNGERGAGKKLLANLFAATLLCEEGGPDPCNTCHSCRQAEGGNQPYDGQVAIGAVVMNRVKSPRYPGSIAEVIYAPGQFGPVSNGSIARYLGGPKASCMQAAQDAINGYTTIGSYTHFRRAGSEVGPDSIVIGSHVFY